MTYLIDPTTVNSVKGCKTKYVPLYGIDPILL